MPKTYGEICQDLSDWFKEGNMDLSPDDVFDLDIEFPGLMISTLYNYMMTNIEAIDVVVSDEYVAKKVWFKLNPTEK